MILSFLLGIAILILAACGSIGVRVMIRQGVAGTAMCVYTGIASAITAVAGLMVLASAFSDDFAPSYSEAITLAACAVVILLFTPVAVWIIRSLEDDA